MLWKIPVAIKDEIMKKIDKLIEQKIVAKVNEPTDLNQALQRPCYPQPTIEDILPQLSKAKVFPVLDAKDGFWQVKLDEESSYLTTF